MKKQIAAFILAVVLIFSGIPVTALAGTTNMELKVDENRITLTTADRNSKSINSFSTKTKSTIKAVSVKLKEIKLPYNSKFDKVNKGSNLDVIVVMSDGSKKKAKVKSWGIPKGFTSMRKAEFTLVGTVVGYGLKAKAHLQIINVPDDSNGNSNSGNNSNNNNNGNGNSNNGNNNTSTSITYDKTIVGKVPDKYKDEFGYNVAKELTNPKYKGRLAGTDTYNASAMYVSNVFEELGLTPEGNNNNYLQQYNMNTAEYKAIPTLKINNTSLTFLEDFKVHGNTSSGTVNSNEVVFVGNGYEEDYANISVKGKSVLFLADVKESKSAGVLDRVVIAKNKGAVAVFLIPNKYMAINSFEKPIKYEDSKIPIYYITREVSKNNMGINVESAAIGSVGKVKIEGKIDITRTANKKSYNVLGMVYGIDQTKTIVISTSLDGYGSLPDGRTANGAATNCASVGALCDLAKYYVNSATPEYNILFAVFGSQAEAREGSKYFINNYSGIKNVITDIDMYDIGNPGSYSAIFNSVDKNYNALHDAVAKAGGNMIDTGEDVNYPFGNNYEFYTKNIPSMFVRYGENLDSLNDNTMKPEAITKVKDYVTKIVSNLLPKFQDNIVFDSSKVKKEYVASIDETMNVYETRLVKLYYEDNFKEAVELAVGKLDSIYANDMWWNYNPKLPNEKIKIYCVNEWDEGWIVTNRMDKKGTGEQGGGYQSFTDFSISIVRLNEVTSPDEIYGTFAHEFNHVCAEHKPIAKADNSDKDNQEISGHVYAFMEGMTMDGNGKPVYRHLVSDLAPGTDITTIDWEEYTGDNNLKLTNAVQWNIHYDRLASVEYYIWQVYGAEVCRDVQYDFYKNPRPSVKSVLESNLNKDFNEIMKEWYNFYQ